MIIIEENISFKKSIQELDLSIPSGISILPHNFFIEDDQNELFYNEEIKTIRKVLSNEGIENIICKKSNQDIVFKTQKSGEWIAPIIFISSLMISENSNLISIALNVISNYATDILKGIPKKKKLVKMEIVCEIEKDKEYTMLNYEGTPEGIKDIPRVIREIKKK